MAPACCRIAFIHGRRRLGLSPIGWFSVARLPQLAGRGLGPQDLVEIGVRKRTSVHRGRGPHPTVDGVPIPPGGALNPILNWIGWPASILVGLGSCGLALKPSVSRGLLPFP